MGLYYKHILSPSSLCFKNNWGTRQKCWWKIGSIHQLYSSLEAACRSWTLILICCLCRVLGHPHSITCLLGFWVILFKPLIWSLPRHDDLWSYDVKYCKTMESCHPYVQDKSSYLYIVWSYWITLILFFPFHVDNEGFIMTFLRQIASCRL